ncbi:hypothetical protein ACIRF8_31885 [Streptomyces sp. NPDC102406]
MRAGQHPPTTPREPGKRLGMPIELARTVHAVQADRTVRVAEGGEL